MNRRGLGLLAIVAIAMAAYLIFEGRRHPGGDGEGARAHERMLPSFDRNAVRLITIDRNGGNQSFSLRHGPSPNAPAPAPAWRLELIGSPAADDAAVEDLLAAIDLAESDRTAEISPEAAGLSPPAVAITMETPSGELVLQLGHADATGRGDIARAGAGGPIRVIGRRVLELADRGRDAFRDPRLFPVSGAAVTAIVWRDARGAGELRAVDGRWQNGRKEWVDDARVSEALRRLLALRIERFDRAPPPQPVGERAVALTTGMGGIAVEGGKDGALVRRAEGVHVPADALEAAWRSLTAAAAPEDRLVTQPPETVTQVKLSDDRAHLTLWRARGAWTFDAPKMPYPADTRVVDDWLTRLGAIRTATASHGPRLRHLTVDGRYRETADVSGPPEVYALLAPDPLRFRERGVLSFARFDVRGLARFAGERVEKLTSEDGDAWRAAAGVAPDAANVTRVVGALSDLRAEEFLATPPAGPPAVRLEIAVQPPGEPHPARHAIAIWARKDGGCVARLDSEATFILERATCEALRLDLTTSGPPR